jgi:ATP-dependent DNA helicase RecQ
MYPDRATVQDVYAKLCSSHADGRALQRPPGRDAESAIRLLLRERIVTEPGNHGSRLRVRLLATPARIQRELSDASRAMELGLIRQLWTVNDDTRHDELVVDLDDLPPGISGRKARTLLERLRDEQFVDYTAPNAGLYLARSGAPLDAFRIDWDTMSRRRTADLRKLDTMQAYAYTKICRRAFVLRYFGDRAARDRCTACDNCAPL